MSAEQQLEKEIREAIVFLRTNNNTVPSDTIQFMLDASLDKLKKKSTTTYCFDCWNRKGKTKTVYIDALDIDTAKLLFRDRYPDWAFDEPYI